VDFVHQTNAVVMTSLFFSTHVRRDYKKNLIYLIIIITYVVLFCFSQVRDLINPSRGNQTDVNPSEIYCPKDLQNQTTLDTKAIVAM
jgi:hypothetical protein